MYICSTVKQLNNKIMITTQLIERFFNSIIKPCENLNEYKPVLRVKSTVKPDVKPTFNDVFEGISSELNKKFKK